MEWWSDGEFRNPILQLSITPTCAFIVRNFRQIRLTHFRNAGRHEKVAIFIEMSKTLASRRVSASVQLN